MMNTQPFDFRLAKQNNYEAFQDSAPSCSAQSLLDSNQELINSLTRQLSISGLPQQPTPPQQISPSFNSSSQGTTSRGTRSYVAHNNNGNNNINDNNSNNNNNNNNNNNTAILPPYSSNPPSIPPSIIPASLRSHSSSPPPPPPASRSPPVCRSPPTNRSPSFLSRESAPALPTAGPPTRPSSKPALKSKFLTPTPRRDSPPSTSPYKNVTSAPGSTPMQSGCPDRKFTSGKLKFAWQGIQNPFTCPIEVLDLAILLPTKDTIASIFGLWDTEIAIFCERGHVREHVHFSTLTGIEVMDEYKNNDSFIITAGNTYTNTLAYTDLFNMVGEQTLQRLSVAFFNYILNDNEDPHFLQLYATNDPETAAVDFSIWMIELFGGPTDYTYKFGFDVINSLLSVPHHDYLCKFPAAMRWLKHMACAMKDILTERVTDVDDLRKSVATAMFLYWRKFFTRFYFTAQERLCISHTVKRYIDGIKLWSNNRGL